jgi:hypothetical protein
MTGARTTDVHVIAQNGVPPRWQQRRSEDLELEGHGVHVELRGVEPGGGVGNDWERHRDLLVEDRRVAVLTKDGPRRRGPVKEVVSRARSRTLHPA